MIDGAPSSKRVTTAQRLVAITGVACLCAVILPEARQGDALRWWWHGGGASALGGVAVALAFPILAASSFVRHARGAAILGVALAIVGTAIWALVVPGGEALVVGSLALVALISELAAPGACERVSTLRWWALGLGAATAALGLASLLDGLPGEQRRIVGIGMGLAAVLAATAVWFPPSPASAHPRQRLMVLGSFALGLAMVAALLLVSVPLVDGRRADAVAAARLTMLLVTAIPTLGALIGAHAATAAPERVAGAARPHPHGVLR